MTNKNLIKDYFKRHFIKNKNLKVFVKAYNLQLQGSFTFKKIFFWSQTDTNQKDLCFQNVEFEN